jgi:hypothetical protein
MKYFDKTVYIGQFKYGTGMVYMFDENMVELGYIFQGKLHETVNGEKWPQRKLDLMTLQKLN